MRYLQALRQEPTDKTPIWIMRQAGRYLPEYRKTREKAGSFLNLCKTPELACEVTLQPLARFDLDAAILFSDILTIPDAMGLGLEFLEGEGPVFKKTIQTLSDIQQLPTPCPETELKYVTDAVRLIKSSLNANTPLIGFSGSPWTLACYMIDGSGADKNFSKTKKMLYSQPTLLHSLLQHLTHCVTDYLSGQIQAGVDSIMIFDTWGGLLTPHTYDHFDLLYMTQIIKTLKTKYPNTPFTLFTKGGGLWLNAMLGSGADCLGLDWTIDIKNARGVTQDQVALQGNLDPCVLYGTEEEIHTQVSKILSQYGPHKGHIFNLGHGIHPNIDPGKVKFLVDLVHSMSAHYHHG